MKLLFLLRQFGGNPHFANAHGFDGMPQFLERCAHIQILVIQMSLLDDCGDSAFGFRLPCLQLLSAARSSFPFCESGSSEQS